MYVSTRTQITNFETVARTFFTDANELDRSEVWLRTEIGLIYINFEWKAQNSVCIVREAHFAMDSIETQVKQVCSK